MTRQDGRIGLILALLLTLCAAAAALVGCGGGYGDGDGFPSVDGGLDGGVSTFAETLLIGVWCGATPLRD